MDASNRIESSSKACVWTTLDKVLATYKLDERAARPPEEESLQRAIESMDDLMDESPKTILQRLVDSAMELCRADSAGVSILEDHVDRPQFRWHAISGQFANNVGGSMPRWSSPCGTVLDRDCALLFQRPEFHFAYSTLVDPPIVEALLVPFHLHGRAVGTVWVIAHTKERLFDHEDVRILKSLTQFASRAVQAMAH